ncbi:EF-hand calcium-binding domain-containing protein 14-like isoform X2 [Ruditapes philippinarum]|uniref:EF-hand calcium-binding domain-containing protein 14-like isoform X2 n=1 Tax=Ruditapes philippinarum TaxID=129788 RepID=UPI00295AABA0|nr:EF-hand calcium-binding domain-containing protein 14-like isoform X2 [Ruditapes philippinarum]
MKKRRELDALVGGGKSRRKNSNSGHELLKYNGSESSDDDFQLSPPKVRGSGLCSTCTSVFIFLLLVACMLVCAGLTWMHVEMKKDLELLRIRLQEVEGRGIAGTDDVEKLFKQMAYVNKTLDQHSKSLGKVTSDISTINRTVLQVSGRAEKLSEGLKAAPELKQLPEKLQTVSQTVATMGSDVKNMKDTVDTVSPFMKTTTEELQSLKQQFDAIKDQVSDTAAGHDRESLKPDLANMIQVLTNQLQTVNSTVSTQMSVLMKSNSQHEERLLKLEEVSVMLIKNLSSLSAEHTSINNEHTSINSDHSSMNGEHSQMVDDYTSDKFKSSVTDILQSLLTGDEHLPSAGNIEGIMVNVSTVLATLKDMEDKYEHISEKTGADIGDNEYVSMEMFKTLGDGFEAKVEVLNSSFVSLKADVTTMSQLLTKQSNTVTNLTHQVEATKLFLTTLMQKIEGPGESKTPTVTEALNPVTKSSTTKPDIPVTSTDAEIKSSTKGPSTTTKQGGQLPGKIHVSFITSPEDLELNFRRWDRSGSGQVNLADLDGFLGPETPKEEDLKEFDEDKNGLYSLQEFAKAFGISLATTTAAVTETEPTPPPR